MLRINNNTFEKHLRNRRTLKKEFNEYKKELKQVERRMDQLHDMIRNREDILDTIEVGDEDGKKFVKHNGVLLLVTDILYTNYKDVPHRQGSVTAPGHNTHRYSKIYTNVNNNKRYGCELSYREHRYSTTKSTNIGSQFEDFDSLIRLCMDWVSGKDVRNYFCDDCIVKASCTTTNCDKRFNININFR